MKITKELKIGIYFSVTVIGLIWGINFLKGMDLFNKNTKIYAIYENVEGLQTTSPIYIKGMKVGTVSKIKLEQNEQFIIELKINSKYYIPYNSIAYIYNADIMGTKAIKIKIGDSDNILKEGDLIQSGREGDMFSMLMDDLPSIKDSLKITIKEVDLTFKNINRFLSDDNLNNLSKSIVSLEKTLQNFSQFSTALNRSKSSLVASLENVEAITGNLNSNREQINNIIKNLSDLSDTLKTVSLTPITDGLQAVLDKINSGTGTAGNLIYNDSLYKNLSNSLSSLESLLNDIKKNPRRYVNISVFGRKSK